MTGPFETGDTALTFDIGSYKALREYFRGWRPAPAVLGRTLYGREVVCLKLGGDRLPPVLITAGAHCDEIAGVVAAARLAEEISTDRTVYLVPCRDPLGWDGFGRCLSLASGCDRAVATHEEACRVLRSQGEVLLTDKTPAGEMVLGLVGKLAFCTTPLGADPHMDLREHLEGLLTSDRALGLRLAGKRVISPSAPPYTDRGPYDWGAGATICVLPDATAGNLNRFFGRPDAPPEVTALARLVNEIRPALTLDLHEGYGHRHYFFTPELDTDFKRRLARSLAAALRGRGLQPDGMAELSPYWGRHASNFVDQGDGMFAIKTGSLGSSLGSTAERYGPAFVTETGMQGRLGDRVEIIRTVVHTALQVMDDKNWDPGN